MDIALVPVITLHNPTISCLDTWGDKLFVGTKDLGVIVYSLLSSPLTSCVHKYLTNGKEVQQLKAIERWDHLIVLLGSAVTIHDIQCNNKMELTNKRVLPHTGVQHFSLHTHGSSPSLSFATHGNIFIYKHNGTEFYVATKFAFEYPVLDMILTPTRLHVIYNKDHGNFCLDTGIFTSDLSSRVGLILASECSTISEHHHGEWTAQQALQWNLMPTAIGVARKTHCIGIRANEVEIVPLQSGNCGAHRAFSAKDYFEFIADKGDIFIASQSTVWRLSSPVLPPLPSPSPSPSSPSPLDAKPSPPSSTPPLLASFIYSFAHSSPSTLSPSIISPPSPPPPEVPKPYESTPLPYSFSPDNMLTVMSLGLTEEDRKYLSKFGILSAEQFGDIPHDVITQHGERFRTPHLMILDFLNQHETRISFESHETQKMITIKPEDTLEVLGLNKAQLELLTSFMIFTVRQFALMIEKDLLHYGDDLLAKRLLAIEALRLHAQRSQVKKKDIYGYMYPEVESATLPESSSLKSAYVLFNEFIECEPEARVNHLWQNVYDRYLPEAKLYHHHNSDEKSGTLSHGDVFSYLCWRHVLSIGNLDPTASARGISNRNLPSISTKSFDINNVIKINLTLLCRTYGGKLFNKRLSSKGYEWIAVTLEEHEENVARGHEDSCASTPHGCIVMPTGTIEPDCITSL